MGERLENKVALITGTSRGMGRSAALLFAKEGAKVIGCARNVKANQETVRMVRDAGGEMISLEPVDLSNEDRVEQLMKLINNKYGKIDVLYNNASEPRFAPAAKMSWEDWKFTISNELDLIFITVKAAIPLMIKHGGGSIINVASIAAIRALPDQGHIAHASSKSGVIGLSRQLALELSPYGIRVNTILPGLIRTPATEALIQDTKLSELSMRKILLRRFGEPEDIANAALFLASNESSYITGTTLVVDGGATAW